MSIPFSAASFLARGLANTLPFLGAAGAAGAVAGAGLGAAGAGGGVAIWAVWYSLKSYVNHLLKLIIFGRLNIKNSEF